MPTTSTAAASVYHTIGGLAMRVFILLMGLLSATTVWASDFLPVPCAILDKPPPAMFHCPNPYVELVSLGTDDTFTRGFHCIATGHSLGVIGDGEGCGGWQGMLAGWELPADSPLTLSTGVTETAAVDYRAEIMEWVIEPCMEAAAALDLGTLDKSDLDMGIRRTDIAQIMAASRSAATQDLAAQISTTATWTSRSAFYPMMLQLCLKSLPGMK